ncbi:regulatory protein, luxR family [Haloechinothrix alba]|uniref:Regulatory protein, luxR family n=1 Tax=Haloechinothrix alba TaxID=664784 RepID=A0A239AJH1_9PSEU|nr:helix-turn-helix transcriptional regulator [Haloechinothrix alba]SNR95689.1 regulatory protein, luxR family [Haloechinothrix alba]
MVDALRVNAFLAILQGDSTDAEHLLSEARDMTDGNPISRAVASVDMTEGLQALLGNRLDDAAERFATALAAFRSCGDLHGEMYTLMLDGMVAMFRPDSGRANARFTEVLERSEAASESWFCSYSTTFLAVDYWIDGDLPRATDLARQALRLKVRFDDHMGVALCFEVLALIAGSADDWKATAVLLGAADTVWGETGSKLDYFVGFNAFHNRCEEQLSAKLPRSARESLRRQGSELPASDAVDFALGNRKHPAAEAPATKAAFAPLTRREWQVAESIAERRSNQQIASKLVISPRTVDGHIEHILSKLGFSTRAQVASWVAERQNRHAPETDSVGSAR